jgi:hypothetical protein
MTLSRAAWRCSIFASSSFVMPTAGVAPASRLKVT